MSEYRSQSRNADATGAHIIPIVVNNNNFAKGEPTLLSFDDAVTLFHEFGHGMHGMLSNVTYQRLSGTNVLRDFVELPSQLFEHWLSEPEVLKKHAKHYATNEVIPDELLDRLMKAKRFNQGFATIEYTASALIDQALHTAALSSTSTADESKSTVSTVLTDVNDFEKTVLAELGIPEGLALRHRPAHFLRKYMYIQFDLLLLRWSGIIGCML
jgi:peptidyl-dipeptidase Dcp